MNKFESLLYGSGNPADVQERANQKLPFLLTKSNLHFWRLGDAIVSHSTRFLVGIAVWSLYDLRLLDALDAAFSNGKRTEHIDVFNLDSCRTQEEILAYFPHIDKVVHTPIVGVWRDGKQIRQGSSYIGRNILVEAFALDREKIVSLQQAG